MAEMQWLTFKKGCSVPGPPLWHLLALRVAPAIEHIARCRASRSGRWSMSAAIAANLQRCPPAVPDRAIYSFEPLAGRQPRLSMRSDVTARYGFSQCDWPGIALGAIYVTTP